MPVQIPLRAKYRRSVKGKFKGGEKAAPKKSRKKVGYERHVAMFGEPKRMTLWVDGSSGKGVMRESVSA